MSKHYPISPERVTRCQDCCCCYFATVVGARVEPRCSDNPELTIIDLRIQHPHCDRKGKKTEWA
jgi:hypothetical protein